MSNTSKDAPRSHETDNEERLQSKNVWLAAHSTSGQGCQSWSSVFLQMRYKGFIERNWYVSESSSDFASVKSITDTLDVNVYGRWKLCSHIFEKLIQQLLATFNQLEHETFLWQKLTKCESANLKNLLTESADNKKPGRLDTSKPLLKTLHHASQAMAGAHIPLVKFNALICAWAGPSRWFASTGSESCQAPHLLTFKR